MFPQEKTCEKKNGAARDKTAGEKSAKEREAKESGNEPEEIKREKKRGCRIRDEKKKQRIIGTKKLCRSSAEFHSWDRGGSNS
ncbi:hypothetical protein [Stomatobaculum longum]